MGRLRQIVPPALPQHSSLVPHSWQGWQSSSQSMARATGLNMPLAHGLSPVQGDGLQRQVVISCSGSSPDLCFQSLAAPELNTPLLLRSSAHPLPALSKLLHVFGAGSLSHWFRSVSLQGLFSCMFQLVSESSSITLSSSGFQCSWLHSFVPLISQHLCEMNTLVCDYRQCWRFSPNEVPLKTLNQSLQRLWMTQSSEL